VDASPDGILIVDEIVLRSSNPAAGFALGAHDAAQVIGRSIVDCLDADVRDGSAQRLLRARMGEVAPFEARIVRPDGTLLDVSVTAAPLPSRAIAPCRSRARDHRAAAGLIATSATAKNG
jgi:PAS domain S-box-containing protein